VTGWVRDGHGWRDQKKQLTRERLEQSALALFEEKGYVETTVERIAEAALVSPRTFYRYFPSKYDLVFADAPKNLDHLLARLAERPAAESAREALRNALREYAVFLDRPLVARRAALIEADPELRRHSLEVREIAHRAVARALARRLRASPRGGEVRVMAELAIAVIVTAIRVWVEQGAEPGALPEIVDELAGQSTL
jgi:AcrR family transcriptional regulator